MSVVLCFKKLYGKLSKTSLFWTFNLYTYHHHQSITELERDEDTFQCAEKPLGQNLCFSFIKDLWAAQSHQLYNVEIRNWDLGSPLTCTELLACADCRPGRSQLRARVPYSSRLTGHRLGARLPPGEWGVRDRESIWGDALLRWNWKRRGTERQREL